MRYGEETKKKKFARFADVENCIAEREKTLILNGVCHLNNIDTFTTITLANTSATTILLLLGRYVGKKCCSSLLLKLSENMLFARSLIGNIYVCTGECQMLCFIDEFPLCIQPTMEFDLMIR